MNNTDRDRRLRETIQYAYEYSAEVRERFDQANIRPGEIRTRGDLTPIPVRTKDEVIALQQADPPFGGLLAVAQDQIRHIFFSPGPLYEPEAEDDDPSPYEMAKLVFEWSGFELGDVVLNSLSYHLVPAGLLVDRTLTEMGCTVVPGGVGNSDLQLKMMSDLAVTGYAGTPSFLMQLIQKAEDMGLDFKRDFKLRKIVTTAEPLPPPLRQRFTDQYGLSVGNCYATAELGLLALDTVGGMAMRLLPEPVIQVVDPDTGRSVGPGEAGEVVVTNYGRAYPLIRFGTGDLAVKIDANPGASRQEERMIILVGRRGEAVKVRGMFVHPNQLRYAMAQVSALSAFQGIVTRLENRDILTVQVALERQPDDTTTLAEKLKASIQAACRVRADVIEFVPVEAIPPDAPGMIDNRSW